MLHRKFATLTLNRFWRDLCAGQTGASSIGESGWRQVTGAGDGRPACWGIRWAGGGPSSRSSLVGRRNIAALWHVGRRPRAAGGFGRCAERVGDKMVEWPSRRAEQPARDSEARYVWPRQCQKKFVQDYFPCHTSEGTQISPEPLIAQRRQRCTSNPVSLPIMSIPAATA
jgi:hypothetical protein